MSVALMLAWVFFIAVLGVTMAIPMKRQMINIEQLRFPSGTFGARAVAKWTGVPSEVTGSRRQEILIIRSIDLSQCEEETSRLINIGDQFAYAQPRSRNMHHLVSKFTRNASIWAAVVAVVGAAGLSASRADETHARSLLKAMSDYLAAQKAISFEMDSTLEVVTKEGQKLALVSSGALTLNRPDKLHATRKGGFADVELVFDGKTVTLLGKHANAYAQTESPGTIDQLVDVLRDKYRRPVPAADLLMSNPYNELMPLVVNTKDLGSGIVRGIECDHLAFRTEEVDWQIWIAQGPRPYPCRYVITSTKVAGLPQYTIDVRSWKTGAEVAPGNFSLQIPTGARKLNPGDLPDYDELPTIFAVTR